MLTRPKQQSEIALIGGGVIGLLTAVELAEAGFQVSLFDQGKVGQEASWAGGGILSPLYPWNYPPELLKLAFYSMSRYPALVTKLSAQTGIDPEWMLSGLSILHTSANPIPNQALTWAESWGLTWTRQSTDKGEALWCPEVAQVRNPRFLTMLVERCRQLGVTFHEDITVTGFQQDRDRLRGLQTTQGFFPTTQAIVTAGAWAGKLLEAIGISLPIYPVRGQMLLLQTNPGTLNTMVMKDHRYLVPRRDGLILVGSTSETVDFDKSVTAEAREALWNFAAEMLPGLTPAHLLRQWSGLRPGSADSIPYIGPLPGWHGLWVAAGHFRYGITNAPATAEILVAMLTNSTPPLDISPYQVIWDNGNVWVFP